MTEPATAHARVDLHRPIHLPRWLKVVGATLVAACLLMVMVVGAVLGPPVPQADRLDLVDTGTGLQIGVSGDNAWQIEVQDFGLITVVHGPKGAVKSLACIGSPQTAVHDLHGGPNWRFVVMNGTVRRMTAEPGTLTDTTC